ncbi:hypothetical protein [Mycobacterium sp.]|uniref:hypothetical protein n=1 Tax=Mycobacterium sp. TaxID=1785 RepID=UPI0031D84D3A
MSTTFRLAQRWGVGVSIAAGAAVVATAMATMSGAPATRADDDSYSELLNSADTTLTDAYRQFETVPLTGYGGPEQEEEYLFQVLLENRDGILDDWV